MIDPQLLTAFMHTFYGYGTYAAKYWFLGMEEGGGSSIEELARRIHAWDQRGRRELEDLSEYHQAIGIGKWFGPNPKIQMTWARLIRVVLTAEGRRCDTDRVRRYQAGSLGRSGGDTALLELLPLPSKGTAHWIYSDLGIEALRSRDEYKRAVAPSRLEHLRNRTAEHKPRAVVCYGEADRWKSLFDLEETSPGFAAGRLGDTAIFALNHPTAYGMTNAQYEAIGRAIGQLREAR